MLKHASCKRYSVRSKKQCDSPKSDLLFGQLDLVKAVSDTAIWGNTSQVTALVAVPFLWWLNYIVF